MLNRLLMWIRPFTIALYSMAGICCAAQPIELRVGEGFSDPIGFYDPLPVFSWKLPVAEDVKAQTAYQIVVSQQSESGKDTVTVWDSGKVESDQSAWVPYEGPALKSRQHVFWRVKFWDDQGRQSAWSDEASIEMGLLGHNDWKAKWIDLDRGKRLGNKVTVLKAEFGNRTAGASRVKNVTENIRRAIQRGSTPIRVVPARMGGDPAPGEAKTLWVDYEINGVGKQIELPENRAFDPYPAITAHPAYYLRRKFDAPGKIVKARLYASALGIYEFQINGKRVGKDMLAPGYTMYSKRVESLTYDVTDLLNDGSNAIGAVLGEGWYAGNLLLRKRTELLDLTPKLLGQLELTFADGRVEMIATDDQWRVTDQGPIRAGGFYHGEDYDASKELGQWTQPGFSDDDWKPVTQTPLSEGPQVVPKSLPPVRVMEQVQAVKLSQPEPGKYVFDFGQNLVGVPTIAMPVTKGETVQIRFAEMLQQDGTLYTTNYRTARSQATYVAAETGTVTYQPSLSFFGYRYVELSGLSAGDQLTTGSVIANVIHTDFSSKGQFTSSHDKLNQLQSNIRWGQIGNFIDIPTDCPQRDERLGWTGDAQAFLPTSFFNYDVYSFWSRWLQSVRNEQTDDGQIPHTVPATNFGYSSPGWADVIVTAPWEVYERTGDIRILRDNYEAMKKWVGVYERQSTGFIPTLTGFGDWLQPYAKLDRKGDTAQDLIATAYFGRDARILNWTSTALGKTEDANRYKKLHRDIQRAFTARYFPDGNANEGAETQTACLMGLGYDLIEPDQREHVEAALLQKYEEAGRHLQTGFLGTPLLAPVFDELGHPEICFELLFRESYPSWFYSINQGATTMWERWNSYSHADGFGDASMNSFNHYAYGAIGQFMYERVAGLTPDPKHPGFKHFFIRPLIGGPLDSVSAELDTPYGTAKSGWTKVGGKLTIDAIVPPNTTATTILPSDHGGRILINGKRLAEDDGAAKAKNPVTIELMPGTYQVQIIEESTVSKTDAIVPPAGGQNITSFGPDHEIVFQTKNVQADSKWVPVNEMPFDHAYRIDSDTRFSDRKNTQVQVPIVRPVEKGDVVLVSFWVRRPNAGGQPNNIYLSIDADDESGYEYHLSAYREWKQHVRSFVAEKDVQSSNRCVCIDLGESGTIVEIADLQLLNYGPNRDITNMPRSTVSIEAARRMQHGEKKPWLASKKFAKVILRSSLLMPMGTPFPMHP